MRLTLALQARVSPHAMPPNNPYATGSDGQRSVGTSALAGPVRYRRLSTGPTRRTVPNGTLYIRCTKPGYGTLRYLIYKDIPYPVRHLTVPYIYNIIYILGGALRVPVYRILRILRPEVRSTVGRGIPRPRYYTVRTPAVHLPYTVPPCVIPAVHLPYTVPPWVKPCCIPPYTGQSVGQSVQYLPYTVGTSV